MLVVDRVRPARCKRAQCGARHVMAWTRWCLVCSCLPSTLGTGLCSPTWALTLFPSHPLSMASLYPRFMLSSTNLSGKSLILANCFFYCPLCYIMTVRWRAAGKSGMRSSTVSGGFGGGGDRVVSSCVTTNMNTVSIRNTFIKPVWLSVIAY